MAGALQMSSEERNEEQTVLGKETKFQAHRCQHHGSVYVTAMIGYENVAGVWINLFQTFYDDANTAQAEQHPPPEPSDLVRPTSGVVKEGGHERHYEIGRASCRERG